MSTIVPTRRKFIALATTSAAVFAAGAAAHAATSRPDDDDPSAIEDLMREHALLERILLVYDDVARRLDEDDDVSVAPLARAAGVVRRYIEDHHERDEEKHVFPRLVARHGALVTTLRTQHDAGRKLTSEIIALADGGARDEGARARLARAVRGFSRMYRPHAAQENTVLFVALRAELGARGLDALRGTLEREERATFGDGLFESMLAEVDRAERDLGLEALATFTPRGA